MNSREWSVKANAGMPSNVMTQIIFSKYIKRNSMFIMNRHHIKKTEKYIPRHGTSIF
jgi:hypothetical protein